MTWHTVRSAWETNSNAKEIKPSSPMVFWIKTLMVNHLTVGKICHLITQPFFNLTCAFHSNVRTFYLIWYAPLLLLLFKWSVIIHIYYISLGDDFHGNYLNINSVKYQTQIDSDLFIFHLFFLQTFLTPELRRPPTVWFRGFAIHLWSESCYRVS